MAEPSIKPLKNLPPHMSDVGRRRRVVPLAPVPYEAHSLTESRQTGVHLLALLNNHGPILVALNHQQRRPNAIQKKDGAILHKLLWISPRLCLKACLSPFGQPRTKVVPPRRSIAPEWRYFPIITNEV